MQYHAKLFQNILYPQKRIFSTKITPQNQSRALQIFSINNLKYLLLTKITDNIKYCPVSITLCTILCFLLFPHFLIQYGKNRLCTAGYWQTVNRVSDKNTISACNITDIKFQSNIRTFLIIFTI